MQIRLEDIGFRYAGGNLDRAALCGLNLTLSAGEAVGLIGPSGSGKSTLAQVLNGLLRPDRGRLFFDGKQLNYRPKALHYLRRQIGLIMQMPEAQIFEATVFKEVAYAARQWGLPDAEIRGRVDCALAEVGLKMNDFGPRDPMRLSGGEARLVTIASLLVVDPAWLILDEPTLGLDYAHTQQIRLLVSRRREAGCGTVLISHDLDLVFDLCPRTIILRDGRLLYDGDTAALLGHHDFKGEFGLENPTGWEIQRRLTLDRARWNTYAADLDAMIAELSPRNRAHVEKQIRKYLEEVKPTEAVE